MTPPASGFRESLMCIFIFRLNHLPALIMDDTPAPGCRTASTCGVRIRAHTLCEKSDLAVARTARNKKRPTLIQRGRICSLLPDEHGPGDFSSNQLRNSRRRILPTGLLGSSAMNSTWRGTL